MEMQYRDIGKTGKKASIIGLGCEHLDNKPYGIVEETINAAINGGVNYMDVFMPGREVRENIAKALGSKRKDVFLQAAIGSTDVNKQYDISRDLPSVKKYFEDGLRIFGGYIDFGLLFFIDTEEDFKKVFHGGIADYAQSMKQKGYIGHIGFSSHKPEIAAMAVNTGLPEIMMFSINLAFDLSPASSNVLDMIGDSWGDGEFSSLDPERLALYKLCAQKGVGISVMKTLGAGKLISDKHTPFSKAMSVSQCVHYALSRPSVFTVLPGCQSERQVADALSYLDAADEEKDYGPFLGEIASNFSGKCVYCSHCLPCPSNIDIASVNKYLDIARLDTGNIPPSVVSHYKSLGEGGSKCIACKSCEKRCPFNVPIIENMAEAARLFGE